VKPFSFLIFIKGSEKRTFWRPQLKVSGLCSICQIPMIRSRTSGKFVRALKRMQKRRNVKEIVPRPQTGLQGESFAGFHLQDRSGSPSICSFFPAVHSWGCLFSPSAFCALEISRIVGRGLGHLRGKWVYVYGLSSPHTNTIPDQPLCGQHGSNETFRPRRWPSGTQAFFLRTPLVFVVEGHSS